MLSRQVGSDGVCGVAVQAVAGVADLGAELAVPPRRLGELARYGMTADAWLIRRHPDHCWARDAAGHGPAPGVQVGR